MTSTADYLASQQKAMTEGQFQANVIDAAQKLGWKVAHFRSVRTARADGSVYYATPVQADGEGFPDLILTRPGRLIFAELKSKKGTMSEAQKEWWRALGESERCERYLWRPSEFEEISEILRGDA